MFEQLNICMWPLEIDFYPLLQVKSVLILVVVVVKPISPSQKK